MTPFGEAMRELRRRKGVSQKQMAAAIGVSAAYLSALEHGKRGAPSFDFLQRVAGYFNVIWDEADELFRIADISDPKVVLDTSGLPPGHTAFANRLGGRYAVCRKRRSGPWKIFWKKPQFLIMTGDESLFPTARRGPGFGSRGQISYSPQGLRAVIRTESRRPQPGKT